MSKKRAGKGDDSDKEPVEASMKTLLELFIEQHRAQQEQQREHQKILLTLATERGARAAAKGHGAAQEATRHTREGEDSDSLTKADPAKTGTQ